MEPYEEITIVENVLRELVEETLEKVHGVDWLNSSGLTKDRVNKFHERRDEEVKRREGVIVEQRLIYYSEFDDLRTIVRKNWALFGPCLGEKKTMEAYLGRLVDFRHPNRHGRELLPFERHLVTGMVGEIRNKVTIYKSQQCNEKEYFPRIEVVRDSFGNVARGPAGIVDTGLILHPGDRVSFECKGWDPSGEALRWFYCVDPGLFKLDIEVDGDSFSWVVEESQIAELQTVSIFLLGAKSYHRHGWHDDGVQFKYKLRPLE